MASAARSRPSRPRRASWPRGTRDRTVEPSASERGCRKKGGGSSKSSPRREQGARGEKPPNEAQMSLSAAGKRARAVEASAPRRRGRRGELGGAPHEGRTGIRGEKPPSQAPMNQVAAGLEARGGSLSLETKRPREGEAQKSPPKRTQWRPRREAAKPGQMSLLAAGHEGPRGGSPDLETQMPKGGAQRGSP